MTNEKILSEKDIVLVREDKPDDNWLGEIIEVGLYFSQVRDVDPGSKYNGGVFYRINTRLEHTDRVA